MLFATVSLVFVCKIELFTAIAQLCYFSHSCFCINIAQQIHYSVEIDEHLDGWYVITAFKWGNLECIWHNLWGHMQRNMSFQWEIANVTPSDGILVTPTPLQGMNSKIDHLAPMICSWDTPLLMLQLCEHESHDCNVVHSIQNPQTQKQAHLPLTIHHGVRQIQCSDEFQQDIILTTCNAPIYVRLEQLFPNLDHPTKHVYFNGFCIHCKTTMVTDGLSTSVSMPWMWSDNKMCRPILHWGKLEMHLFAGDNQYYVAKWLFCSALFAH